MPEPRLTAVVLNYNGRELLEVVLPSLERQAYRDFVTVVVDNGSTDDSVEWLRSTWPDVEVVALPQNVGVTAALNVCIRAATTELVALLNNDLELEPDCIGELVRALDEHPEAASACAKLIDFYDREIIDGAGDYYEWNGEANRRGQGQRDVGQFDEPRETFGACGATAVYRRSALNDVGEFDEQLFTVYEDVDWSFRARLLGYSCRYVPSAVAYHMGSVTVGKGLTDFVLYQNWRNGIWVVAKSYPAAALVRYGHCVLRTQLRNLYIAVRTGRLGVFLRVWRDALRGMPEVLRKRRQIQRRRVAGLDELREQVGA